MPLDYVILGMLALHRMSGYDLRRWMEGPGRYVGFGVQLPHIYRRLAKLAEQGWIQFETDPRDGAPDAKVYTLTEAGEQALEEWARAPYEPSPRPMDPDFKLRFLFGGQLDPQIAIELLRTELDYRRAQRGGPRVPGYDARHTVLQPEFSQIDPEWAREVHTLTHEQGYASTSAYIAWLELTLERLEAKYVC
ncbi:helix-turn-helix transcriptional regulator [Catenulispora sp. NF23]|uniref:Helix-turn-helix transcriptional regulator n=1 Tax=Catenulispora pinistramenti TaxID=2705254 RepID=A0ABS5KIG3_9ACTN|nr:helix-turn-helix transcriptional regulator [Catenulispora pinistramenti]MBS2533882.1 helix-turn-helix transcriptional regulator [Catenulispora pinistramenti]MBS2545908.1 helix-turn-helix transcriptional regulator [Catenulispora pinistramenti]